MKRKSPRFGLLAVATVFALTGNGCWAKGAFAGGEAEVDTSLETNLPACRAVLDAVDKHVLTADYNLSEEDTYLDYGSALEGIEEGDASYDDFAKLDKMIYRLEREANTITDYLRDAFMSDDACMAQIDDLVNHPELSEPGDLSEPAEDGPEGEDPEEEEEAGVNAGPVVTDDPVEDPAGDPAGSGHDAYLDPEVVWQVYVLPYYIHASSYGDLIMSAIGDKDTMLFAFPDWESLLTSDVYAVAVEFYAYDAENNSRHGILVNSEVLEVEVHYADDSEAADPSDPGTTDPVDPSDPGTTDPSDPGTSDPADPGTSDPSGPGTTDPSDPGTTDPSDPGTTDPSDPGEGEDPVDPGTSTDPVDPSNPGTSDPSDPGTTDPVDPSDPGTTDPSDPGTSDPADPGTSTDPSDPGTTTPTDPSDPGSSTTPTDPSAPGSSTTPTRPSGPNTLTDAAGEIQLDVSKVDLPDDVEFRATDVTTDSKSQGSIRSGEELLSAYDFTLHSDAEGEDYTVFNDGVTLRVPISDADAARTNLYARYINSAGESLESDIKVEVVGATGDYAVEFTVKHFSRYAIVATDTPIVIASSVPTPGTTVDPTTVAAAVNKISDNGANIKSPNTGAKGKITLGDAKGAKKNGVFAAVMTGAMTTLGAALLVIRRYRKRY